MTEDAIQQRINTIWEKFKNKEIYTQGFRPIKLINAITREDIEKAVRNGEITSAMKDLSLWYKNHNEHLNDKNIDMLNFFNSIQSSQGFGYYVDRISSIFRFGKGGKRIYTGYNVKDIAH